MKEENDGILRQYGTVAKKRMRHDYINNADFKEAIRLHKIKVDEAVAAGKEKPSASNYIGKCLILIAEKMATRANFSGYPFRDEMVMDGVYAAIRAVNNFDGERGFTPFAYFSRIIWNAFLKRIADEKQELYTKFKATIHVISGHDTYEGSEIGTLYNPDTLTYINKYVEDYETKMRGDDVKKEDPKDE